MSRRLARELVLHLVFAGDYGEDCDQLLSRLKEENLARWSAECKLYQKPPAKAQEEYVRQATKGIMEHLPELDSYIEKYSTGWNVGRISRITKSALRLSMYEMLYLGIPVGASVNEILELVKKYDSEEAATFVNGILGTFVKQELDPPQNQLQ